MHDWQYIGERKYIMYRKENYCPIQCDKQKGKMHNLWCQDSSLTLKCSNLLCTLQKQPQASNIFPRITTIFDHVLNYGYNNDWERGTNDGTKMGSLLLQAYKQ